MPRIYEDPVAGAVRWRAKASGEAVLLDGWVEAHIKDVYVPELRGIATAERQVSSGWVPFYLPAASQLKAAFAEIGDMGLLSYVLTLDGTYVPRVIRGTKAVLSKHALGLAIDLNAPWNPMGGAWARKGRKGTVLPLVPIFKAHGFFWGGEFKNRKDGMHFEVRTLCTVPPKRVTIAVNGMETTVPCALRDGAVWAQGRALAYTLFPSAVAWWDGSFLHISKSNEEQARCLNGIIVDAIAWVRVADVLKAFGIKYSWDNDKKELAVVKDAP